MLMRLKTNPSAPIEQMYWDEAQSFMRAGTHVHLKDNFDTWPDEELRRLASERRVQAASPGGRAEVLAALRA